MLWSDAVILGLLAAVGIGVYVWRRIPRHRPPRGRSEVSRRHLRAVEFLEEQGYAVRDVGPVVSLTTRVDGRAHPAEVQADLIAVQGRRTFVVHLRGADSRRLTARPVRRQLLEYVVAYRPDGILLVDLERRRIRRVEFLVGGEAARRAAHWLRWLGAAGAGAAATYLLVRLTA
ncbi:MAG TPA: hypothetical protein VF282_09950 [Bacillota bacterium]